MIAAYGNDIYCIDDCIRMMHMITTCAVATVLVRHHYKLTNKKVLLLLEKL